MKKLISGRGTLVWLAVLLLLFIGISYFITPNKPEEYPGFVSESPSPTGVKAIYTYLDNETGTAQRWSHDPDLLPKEETNQLLIMVEPFFTPDKGVMNEYISFMEAGNTILLLKANPDGMFDLKTEPDLVEFGKGTVRDSEGTTYQAEKFSPFRLVTNDDDDVLMSDDAGTIAMKRSYKNGTLIAAAEPSWITNDMILEEDHLPLVLSLQQLPNQDWDAIYFDEYLHGSQNVSSITTLYPKWLLIVGFQVLLFTLIWLWYKGKRFGSIVVPREETVRFSDERIRAVAAWYQRGHLYQDSLAMQADYVKLLLQEKWGVPYHKDWTDIAVQLERRWKPLSEEEIRVFLHGVTNVLRKGRVSKQEYILWSKKIDRLRKEVEEG